MISIFNIHINNNMIHLKACFPALANRKLTGVLPCRARHPLRAELLVRVREGAVRIPLARKTPAEEELAGLQPGLPRGQPGLPRVVPLAHVAAYRGGVLTYE